MTLFEAAAAVGLAVGMIGVTITAFILSLTEEDHNDV